MHFRLGECAEAARHLERAIALTTSRAEKHYLQEKLRACQESPTGRA